MAPSIASRSNMGMAPSRSRSASKPTACTFCAAGPRNTLGRALIDELIVALLQHDLVRLLEGADDLDDVVPGLFHIPQADWPEQVDLFGQVAGGPFGQVAHDLVAHLGGGALEGEGQVLGVE